MKIVSIGAIGHAIWAYNSIAKSNGKLQLCGYASAVPDDTPAGTLPNAQIYESYERMLDELKPDVAIVSSVYGLNDQISLACLERGVHCFTEKTIAHSMKSLEKIKTTAAANKATIVGMHTMRYDAEFYAGHKAFQSGVIGEALQFYGRKSYRFGKNGREQWYKSRKLYGSTILWVGVHALDFCYWFGGPMTEVFARHSRKGNRGYGDCEFNAIISSVYENGALGTITTDFCRANAANPRDDDQLRIAGTEGVIEIRHGKAFLSNDEFNEKELELEPEGDFFADFCAELQGHGKCRVSMADTLEVTRLGLLALKDADNALRSLIPAEKCYA